MGRFSPTVLPGPSWTNAMAQGIGSLGDALIQRRDQQTRDKQQAFENNIQTQNEARQNAIAGYDPSYIPSVGDANSGTVAPSDLSRLSNAGVADASRPNYDPTNGLAYQLMQGREAGSLERTQAGITGRLQVAGLNNDAHAQRDANRFGSFNNGVYTPGTAAAGHIFQDAPLAAYRQAALDGLNANRTATLKENTRHHKAEEARPVGGGNFSIGGSGSGASNPTTAEATFIRNRQAALQKTQSVPLPDPQHPNAPSILTGSVPGMNAAAAHQEAKHEVNLARPAGADTIPDAPAVAPHVPRDSRTVPTVVPPQGNVKTLNGGNVTDQHTTVVNHTLPASPTDGNAPAYATEAAQYQAAEAAIKASSAPDKLQRLATLRQRYNARVAALAAPKQ